MEFYDDYLAHHGVKGQKWGKITWLDKLGVGNNPEIKALVGSYMQKYDNYKNLKALRVAGKATKDQVENAKNEAKSLALKYRDAISKLSKSKGEAGADGVTAEGESTESADKTKSTSSSVKDRIQAYVDKKKADEEAAPALKAERKAKQDAIKAEKKAAQAEKDAQAAAEAAQKEAEKAEKERLKQEKAAAKAQKASSGGSRSSGGSSGGSQRSSSGQTESSKKQEKSGPETLYENESSNDPRSSFTSSRGSATSSTFPTKSTTSSSSSRKSVRDLVEERLGGKSDSRLNTTAANDLRARLERARNGLSTRSGISSNVATEASVSRGNRSLRAGVSSNRATESSILRRTKLGSFKKVKTTISKDIRSLNVANKRKVFDSWLSVTNN